MSARIMWFNSTIISLFSTLNLVLWNTPYRLMLASYRMHKEYAKVEKNMNKTTVFFGTQKNLSHLRVRLFKHET